MNKIISCVMTAAYFPLLFITTPAVAANFNITPVGSLPTTVRTGQTVSAYFTIRNQTASARNGYVVNGLPETVTQNTTSPMCSNPINLPAHAQCQLQLDITGAVSAGFALCKGMTCTTSAASLNVVSETAPAPETFAYITNQPSFYNSTNHPSTVTRCSINETTGVLEECQSAGAVGIPFDTQGIAINGMGTMAYMTGGWTYNPLTQCRIDSSTKLLVDCTQSSITSSPTYQAYYGFLALNSDATNVYFVGYGQTTLVFSSPIVDDIVQGINTVNTGFSSGDGYAVGITLNATNTVAYIANSTSTSPPSVSTCTVDGNSFTLCGDKTGDGNGITFSNPTGVALNASGTMIYIASGATVYGCDVDGMNTNATVFSRCIVAMSALSPRSYGIAINNQNTMAYVTARGTTPGTSTVYTCPIQDDGTFSSCTATTGFQRATDIALL